MNNLKSNNKHLVSVIVAVLLIVSLNLNVFASASTVIHFADNEFTAYYYPSGTLTECTSNVSVSSTTQTVNGNSKNCTIYMFTGTSNYDKLLNTGADLNLYANSNYTYNLDLKVGLRDGYKYNLIVQIWYSVNGELTDDAPATSLYDGELSSNTWNSISGSFKTPNVSGTVEYALLVMIRTTSTDSTMQLLYLTDLSIVIDDPLYSGVEFDNALTEDIVNNVKGEYEDVMNALPEIDGEELDSLLNFDFEAFSNSMLFVRTMFDRTLSVFGFSAVLAFALSIGLVVYIIGRKVG